jgi:hypothetical protein
VNGNYYKNIMYMDSKKRTREPTDTYKPIREMNEAALASSIIRTAAARASVAPAPRGHSNIVGVKRPRSRGGKATKKSKTNKRNRTNKCR